MKKSKCPDVIVGSQEFVSWFKGQFDCPRLEVLDSFRADYQLMEGEYLVIEAGELMPADAIPRLGRLWIGYKGHLNGGWTIREIL